jgi:hypothetical protein
MDFGIALEMDAGSYPRAALIRKISDALTDYLRARNYGEGVGHIFVGLICQKTVAGFEAFAKQERKPAYKSRETVALIGGGHRELRNTYTYDVKLDADQYRRFVSGPESEARTLVIDVLLKSLTKLDGISREVADFDVQALKAGIADCLSRRSGAEGS